MRAAALRPLATASACAALLLAANACQTAAPRAAADSPLAILEAQQAAWNAGDLEGFMAAGYQPGGELTFFSDGEPRKGYDELLARYRKHYLEEADHGMGRLVFSQTDLVEMGDAHALVRGHWQLDYAGGGADGGWFTLVFQRYPAGWRILHDHTSESAD
ncbi:MAG TPA: nuclear transport factor 2 family protein [Planctomycetota bacterium]